MQYLMIAAKAADCVVPTGCRCYSCYGICQLGLMEVEGERVPNDMVTSFTCSFSRNHQQISFAYCHLNRKLSQQPGMERNGEERCSDIWQPCGEILVDTKRNGERSGGRNGGWAGGSDSEGIGVKIESEGRKRG